MLGRYCVGFVRVLCLYRYDVRLFKLLYIGRASLNVSCVVRACNVCWFRCWCRALFRTVKLHIGSASTFVCSASAAVKLTCARTIGNNSKSWFVKVQSLDGFVCVRVYCHVPECVLHQVVFWSLQWKSFRTTEIFWPSQEKFGPKSVSTVQNWRSTGLMGCWASLETFSPRPSCSTDAVVGIGGQSLIGALLLYQLYWVSDWTAHQR